MYKFQLQAEWDSGVVDNRALESIARNLVEVI